MKQLLIDTMTIRPIVQESNGSGKLVVRGQFALSDVKTENNRVYRRSLWEKQISRLQKAMENRKVYGECDHPSDGRTKLSRVSHLLTNLKVQDDGTIVGEAEIMNTTDVKQLRAIFEAGGQVGVSSRGYGSVINENGFDIVQDDYVLDTFDFVADPAQPTAYPTPSVESKQKTETTEQPAAMGNAPVVHDEKPADSELKPDADGHAVSEPPPSEQPEADATKVEQGDMVPTLDDVKSVAADKPEEGEAMTTPEQKSEAKILAAILKAKQEVAEQIRSELMSDPSVAGAKTALESIKNILMPYILPNDVKPELGEIKDLRSQLESAKRQNKSLMSEKTDLERAVKDLGFNLYLRKEIGNHPKFEGIVKSLGDLTKIESLESLSSKVKIYKEQCSAIRFVDANLLADKVEENKMLKEQSAKVMNRVKTLTAERDEAIKTANEAMLRSYLERKIVANPKASAIRTRYESLRVKTKDSVDQLIESFSEAPTREGSEFSRIRARLGGRAPASLVEDSVRPTMRQIRESDDVVELDGVEVNMKDFESLAGIR
jgi:hypothetical protein